MEHYRSHQHDNVKKDIIYLYQCDLMIFKMTKACYGKNSDTYYSLDICFWSASSGKMPDGPSIVLFIIDQTL